MREYIDRDAVLNMLNRYFHSLEGNEAQVLVSDIKHATLELPTADVAEVMHGTWKLESEIHKMLDDVDEEFYVKCPFCNRTEWVGFDFEPEKMLEWAKKEYPYCHCGAKMDGKETLKDE